ncbi:37S ribosomal protein S5 [Talaromyces stipitatus ATCC 10500]|uniref:Small ribosomal subunit protein uS5m n=1 Tax=Talaromyces stipitatus (strain ATCC 10500 / CBS 375.48 / QM 6759 / NRRL 1006) TaxID=441959 RepID=B8LTI6_TALSN|nr:mitochondrial 37S ribosomal protein MRPS5 [Talaromyces stipitatus ATCC 10500]EED23064.1 37S ribosomal protein S5 [Talaromyces stipitatus ATCC 10500]
MNVLQPARCLFCSFSQTARVGARVPVQREFHAAAALYARKPPGPRPTAKKPGQKKTWDDIEKKLRPSDFADYSSKELRQLSQEYTEDQVAAILAAEKAIDPKDLVEQFAIRNDPMKLGYLDDFSTIEPVVDKHIRAPESNSDWHATLKSEDDFAEDFAKFFAEMPDNATAADWVRFTENLRLTKGKEENERNPSSALVPDIFEEGETLSNPFSKDVEATSDQKKKKTEGNRSNEEITDALKRLMQSTGYSLDKIKSLKVKTLVSHAVVNQTRLGKVRRQYCLSVAGNGDGLLGIGEAKSEEASDAVTQSKYRAIRNMQPILRYENRTIYGDVKGKVGAVELKLMNRPPGFGLRCQHLIYEMARAAGIHDLAARVERSRNPMNTVKAAYEALTAQKDPEEIARARGRKLVDVRKVYYAGRV